MDNFNFKKFLAEGKLKEETEALDRESVIDMAQMVADEFTKEDASGDKFSTYMVYKVGKVDGLGFELDTEATEQTPAEEAKYGAGEGMGGIFRINVLPNGYEIRNVEKGGLVATMDMEDGFKMLSADESRAELNNDEPNPGMYIDDEEWEREMGRMEENKEEKKSNKMKKSELKEMIRTAFLNETQVEEAAGDNKVKELLFHAEAYKDGTIDKDDLLQAFEEILMMEPVGDIPGFEGTMDTLDSLSIREEEEEDVEVNDEENVDVEVEDDVEVDVDDESVETDTVVKTELPGENKDVTKTLGLLTKAQETAKALGDDKLTDQIGNTITYFTRAHVARQQTNEVKVNEVTFPMWSKINK